MSTNKKNRRYKQISTASNQEFKKPSLITDEAPIGDELDIINDMSEIEVDQTFIRYTGTAPLSPPLSPSKQALNELHDAEPYNRRQSFLQDMHHEPYWQQEKEYGSHPFQTPKSTKGDSTPFFVKNVVQQHTINGNNMDSPSVASTLLLDSPKTINNNQLARNSESYSTNTDNTDKKVITPQSNSNSDQNLSSSIPGTANTNSIEMTIPEENELIQMPIVNEQEQHNGRITSYVRNGQMNPISLYNNNYSNGRPQQQRGDNNHENHNGHHSHSHHSHRHNTHNNNNNGHMSVDDDSYEDSHISVDDVRDIVPVPVTDPDNYNNTSFLKANQNDKNKKVSFGGVSSTATFAVNGNGNNNGSQLVPLQQTTEQQQASPHLTAVPHILVQSATNGENISLQQSVMATLTPNGQKIGQSGNFDYAAGDHQHHNNNNMALNNLSQDYNNLASSRTAPSSPLQKKFKFAPPVSNIKNQRHSVVSIAMIQKIREKKMMLETNHRNGGTVTPSLSVGSLDEEYDHDDPSQINQAYYNNDSPHLMNGNMNNNMNMNMMNATKPTHQVPYIQRSGTEDDILHQKSEKNRKASQYKPRSTNPNTALYRNGAQSTTSSPKYGAKKNNFWKKAHSYRPQKEPHQQPPNEPNNNNLQQQRGRRNSHLHSKTEELHKTRDPINSTNPISPTLRRTKSELSKNKHTKQQMLQQYKTPPATDIISETASNSSLTNLEEPPKNNSIHGSVPSSMFNKTTKSSNNKDRMNKIDIENLIPLTVSRYISYMAEKTGSPKLIPPQKWDFTTVAMFADVSGFTKLSEYLAKAGAGGAEKLAFYLNRYLEQLANKARKEGGDVFKFAGDAIIIVWPPDFDEDQLDPSKQKILREERIARAVQAARAIQNEFHNMEIIKGAITLSVKIGIGYGPSSLLFVGGQFGRIEYLLCGSSLKQAFDCESYASPGDVIISKEAYQHVKEKYVYGRPVYENVPAHNKVNAESPKKGGGRKVLLNRALSSGKHSTNNSQDVSHLNGNDKDGNDDEKGGGGGGNGMNTPNGYNDISPTSPSSTSKLLRPDANFNAPVVYKVMLDRKKYKKVHSKALRSNGRYLISEHLQSFVPRAAWQRLLLRFKPWHGEQRAVTVLFINLDFNAVDDTEKDSASLFHAAKKKKRSNLENVPQDLLQRAVKTTQKCIYTYKGSLNKFLFDDKGSTVIAVFGLPPIANFDDCTRAVLAALLIEQKMKALKIKARIGVTTGRVYIGVVGASGSASEYGILGDQVNLAARLMQHAIKKVEKGGLGGEGVVVSDTTYAQAKECINIDWQRLQSTSVKGFSKEFIIWRPHWRKITGDLSMKRNRFFIGWKETMDEVKSRLVKLTKSEKKERGYVVAIHSDHWGGATQFARQLLHEIHSQIYVVGTTNLAFNDEKLFAWKALLARIVRECRLLRGGDTKEMDLKFRKSFKRFLRDTGGEHLIKYLPVLNELLNTEFESDDYSINAIVPKLEQVDTRFGHQKLKSYAPPVDPEDDDQKGMDPQQILNRVQSAEEDKQRNAANMEPEIEFTEDEKIKLLLKYRVEIIIHLLKQVSKYSTMVILISKFQYMDLDDWAITETIANKIYNRELCDVSLVLAGWSMDTKSLTYLISPEEQQIQKNFQRIKKLCWLEFVLPKWTKQEVRDFLKYEFDIEKPSKNVLHFIVNKTDGIPGMVKTLVHDQNLLFLKHGGHLDCSQIERCRDIQSGSRYSDINLPIPYAIQSYYTKMLDSLDQFALLTIKCAAVIAVGQEFLSVSFSYDMLYSCHPLRSDVTTDDEEEFAMELHAALSLLEKDRFVYKFKQDKITQEMIRLSDHEDQNHKHDNETFYVFASGFLRDVTYGNMLYKQRSSIHKRVKKMLDREPFNNDELVQNCIRRHHLLSLHDGFYSNRDEVERKREEILNDGKGSKRKRGVYNKGHHHSIWSFPECVLVIYIQDVTGLPDSLKGSSYVTVHVGDDKGKSLTQSMTCHNQYMSVVLNENILKQIEDETVGPVLTMRLWFRQNYRVDKTIGKFTLRLRELYEKQLSEQMLWLQRKSDLSMSNNNIYNGGGGSKRNSLNSPSSTSTFNSNQNAGIYDHTDLFVGYKMTVHVKQKKINRFHLDKQLYIESFIRFCSVDDGSKQTHNLQTMLPFAQQQ